MSDTPETDEQINGKPCTRFEVILGNSLRDALVPSEFARKLERERDRYKSDVEVITKERDEAIRALTNITALPTLAVDQNVVRARKIAQEALRNVEGAK